MIFVVVSIRYKSQIVIGGAPICPTLTIRNLDQSRTMDDLIKHICNAAYFHFHNISSIRNCLSNESTITLVHAFISSRLDYCNALPVGITETSLAKLQRVQNMATRLERETTLPPYPEHSIDFHSDTGLYLRFFF